MHLFCPTMIYPPLIYIFLIPKTINSRVRSMRNCSESILKILRIKDSSFINPKIIVLKKHGTSIKVNFFLEQV